MAVDPKNPLNLTNKPFDPLDNSGGVAVLDEGTKHDGGHEFDFGGDQQDRAGDIARHMMGEGGSYSGDYLERYLEEKKKREEQQRRDAQFVMNVLGHSIADDVGNFMNNASAYMALSAKEAHSHGNVLQALSANAQHCSHMAANALSVIGPNATTASQIGLNISAHGSGGGDFVIMRDPKTGALYTVDTNKNIIPLDPGQSAKIKASGLTITDVDPADKEKIDAAAAYNEHTAMEAQAQAEIASRQRHHAAHEAYDRALEEKIQTINSKMNLPADATEEQREAAFKTLSEDEQEIVRGMRALKEAHEATEENLAGEKIDPHSRQIRDLTTEYMEKISAGDLVAAKQARLKLEEALKLYNTPEIQKQVAAFKEKNQAMHGSAHDHHEHESSKSEETAAEALALEMNEQLRLIAEKKDEIAARISGSAITEDQLKDMAAEYGITDTKALQTALAPDTSIKIISPIATPQIFGGTGTFTPVAAASIDLPPALYGNVRSAADADADKRNISNFNTAASNTPNGDQVLSAETAQKIANTLSYMPKIF